MCLKTFSRGRNNPKTDINCYKVLIHLNGKILAPFTRYEYKLDETLIDSAEEEMNTRFGFTMIGSGYFHACIDLGSARTLKKGLSKIENGEVIIHKAIVPCKTKYYTDNKGNICAKLIKVTSEICV